MKAPSAHFAALLVVVIMAATALSQTQAVCGRFSRAMPLSLWSEDEDERLRRPGGERSKPIDKDLAPGPFAAPAEGLVPARAATARENESKPHLARSWSVALRHALVTARGFGGERWRGIARRHAWPVRVRDLAPATWRVLLVTEDNRILRSQANAFVAAAGEIRRRFGAVVHEVDIACFEAPGVLDHGDFETIFLQPWFDIDPERLLRLVTRARGLAKRVVFLDGYAPADLRFARLLDGRVDYYVKKHVLADRSAYGRPTLGDTNLTDHYARRFGLALPQTQFPVSDDFLSRLIVGPSFFTDAALSARLSRPLPAIEQPFDVHARLGVGEQWGWYSLMRKEALGALQSVRDLRVLQGAGVRLCVYMDELARSKMCFSPFGFGEIAWRDFEAMACGSLLIKPDCGHLELEPDVLRPYETYVPVRWDLADLEEKIRYYRSATAERRRIVENAHGLLRRYLASRAFLDRMAPTLSRPV